MDILIYIALGEEFLDLVESGFGVKLTGREEADPVTTIFHGTVHSPAVNRDFTLGVLPAGTMGNEASANMMGALLTRYAPANVVVLGIAGALDRDVDLGDVFVPHVVKNYATNGAMVGESDSVFIPSGRDFGTTPRLLERFRLFPAMKPEYYAKWIADRDELLKKYVTADLQAKLAAHGLSAEYEAKAVVGDDRKLASGPFVGKSLAFAVNLNAKDRKYVAMEMESAGVYQAVTNRDPVPNVVAIRGISDYADDRKEKIEKLAGKRNFRKLATQNAVAYLRRAIEAGHFERGPGSEEAMGSGKKGIQLPPIRPIKIKRKGPQQN
ncbi:MAG: hypothetical protein JNL05_12005 [Flavobacteriales bacterium]|nr:hypothetical protein [Flavobacteriales bacterium]